MWNFYFDGKWGKLQDPNLFGTCTVPHETVKKIPSFFVYYFLKIHLHYFSKIKSHEEVTKQYRYR